MINVMSCQFTSRHGSDDGSSGVSTHAIRGLVMLLVAASLTHTAAASDGREHLEQNWDSDQRHTFWFTPQGSQLIPYD